MTNTTAVIPGELKAALLGRCPRCCKGDLFQGYLTILPQCTECGLDYASFDAGDGPAVFVILIVGFLVAGGALVLEVNFQPPYWVHAAIWLPTIFILAFGLLRLMKSALLVIQYRNRAGEARLLE